jgi:hypothetical protein
MTKDGIEKKINSEEGHKKPISTRVNVSNP